MFCYGSVVTPHGNCCHQFMERLRFANGGRMLQGSPAVDQPPNTTLCMMRPGSSVKPPAMMSAPANKPIMALLWVPT